MTTASGVAPSAAAAPREPGATSAEVDLLGVLALGELTGFLRLSQVAAQAPTLADTTALGAWAVRQFEHHRLLRDRLTALGVEPEAAMAPFTDALDAFHRRTTSRDWLEGLVKAHVGDGIATDFYREVAAYVDEPTRALVEVVLADAQGEEGYAVRAVREAIAADPRLAGRLALWARRLVGEALRQAQAVAADRDSLADLLVGGEAAGGDLAEVGRMFGRLTDAHVRRMKALGLPA